MQNFLSKLKKMLGKAQGSLSPSTWKTTAFSALGIGAVAAVAAWAPRNDNNN